VIFKCSKPLNNERLEVNQGWNNKAFWFRPLLMEKPSTFDSPGKVLIRHAGLDPASRGLGLRNHDGFRVKPGMTD
jgi:hypothetical protein